MTTEEILTRDDGIIPNSKFPVLIHRGAFRFGRRDILEIRDIVRLHAKKFGWFYEWGVMNEHIHYHSTSHEAHVVCCGSAAIEVGGPRVNAVFVVRTGDVIVIPAGVAHRILVKTDSFYISGLCPDGVLNWDINYAKKKARRADIANIAKLGRPPAFVRTKKA